jgi:hypothetical protein
MSRLGYGKLSPVSYELTFPFNRRTSRYLEKLFYLLIQPAIPIEVVTYSEIIKQVRATKKHNLNI